jgi:hypothetical protein
MHACVFNRNLRAIEQLSMRQIHPRSYHGLQVSMNSLHRDMRVEPNKFLQFERRWNDHYVYNIWQYVTVIGTTSS